MNYICLDTFTSVINSFDEFKEMIKNNIKFSYAPEKLHSELFEKNKIDDFYQCCLKNYNNYLFRVDDDFGCGVEMTHLYSVFMYQKK